MEIKARREVSIGFALGVRSIPLVVKHLQNRVESMKANDVEFFSIFPKDKGVNTWPHLPLMKS